VPGVPPLEGNISDGLMFMRGTDRLGANLYSVKCRIYGDFGAQIEIGDVLVQHEFGKFSMEVPK
jgi:hypothetical protein